MAETEKCGMDVNETRYDIDMYGSRYSYDVDVHYYFYEWADFEE